MRATDRVGLSASAASVTSLVIDSTNPSVSLGSLTGGQSVRGGATTTILWSASDANFGASPIAIELSSDGGSTWTILASSLSNSGSYSWNVTQSDGTTYRVRVTATDAVGNFTRAASTNNFSISRVGPTLTQATSPSSLVSSSLSQVTYGGACDLSASMANTDVSIGGSDSATVPCIGSAPSGTWTWTTPTKSSDAIYSYSFTQTNSIGNSTTITASWRRDTGAPVISAVDINEGAQYVSNILAGVRVTTSDSGSAAGMQVRLAATNSGTACQPLYADNGWQTQSSATTQYSILLPSGDGVKKVCAWAKDQAGNVSVIGSAQGTLGVDMDEITLNTGAPPLITAFSTINNGGGANQGTQNATSGDPLKIDVSVTSNLPLAANAIRIETTTDNATWNVQEAGWGNTSGLTSFSGTYIGLAAPSSGYFRIRVSATDVSGLTSQTLSSPAFNTGAWSVYAGSLERGAGGSARSALLGSSLVHVTGYFAVAPNNDVYIVDQPNAILKLEAATGKVTTFIRVGTTNLQSSPTLSSSSRVSLSNYVTLNFDSKGFLYLYDGSRMFRIDPTTNAVSHYAGGSTVTSATTGLVATDINIRGRFAFDEDDSLYAFSTCSSPWVAGTTGLRILKIAQNSNGTAGAVSVAAGDCTIGTATSGAFAVSQPLIPSNTMTLAGGTIAAWNRGDAIYYGVINNSSTYRKIINGRTFSTTIAYSNTSMILRHPSTGKLIRIRNDLSVLEPNATMANNGDTVEQVLVPSTASGNCNVDGATASTGCIMAGSGLGFLSDGTIVFADGPSAGAPQDRIRFVDGANRLQTLAGAAPFSGDGLSRNLARGRFAALYYKRSTEPLSTQYPEGLYFLERNSSSWGRIGTNETSSILWGNGVYTTSYPAAGTTVQNGLAAGFNSQSTFRFSRQGLPWFKYVNQIVSLDSDGRFVRRNTAEVSDFASVASGSPAPVGAAVAALTYSNMAMKDQGVFMIGRYFTGAAPWNVADPVLRLFDFAGNSITHLMGNNGTTSAPDSTATLNDLTSSSILSSTCSYGAHFSGPDGCAVEFHEGDTSIATDDVLYRAEDRLFRRITNPTTPGSQNLATFFTAPSRIINFTVREDQSQVFYLRSDGRLYCVALNPTGTRSWCNDSSLGPSTGLDTISSCPNQFAWKDANTLFVSTCKGEIYQFSVPQTP